MCNGFSHGDLRSKPKTLLATYEERPLLGQEVSARRPTCGSKRRTGTRQLSERRSLAGQTAPRVGIHGLDAGDRALKDKRRVATEGARREARRQPANLEGKNPERRGSDALAIPDLDYQVFGALPSPQGNKRVQAVQRTAVQRRRLKATTVPRSRRPSPTTTVENASGVRCNGCVGRPVLVCRISPCSGPYPTPRP